MTKGTPKDRRVREVVTFWPPSSWTSSYSGTDALTPGPSAIIAAVRRSELGVSLRVRDGDRFFSTAFAIEDPERLADLVTTLEGAEGLSLEEAGDLVLAKEES